jgi:hypothetical protein
VRLHRFEQAANEQQALTAPEQHRIVEQRAEGQPVAGKREFWLFLSLI